MKVYMETLGCPKNFNDTQVAKGIMAQNGIEIVEEIQGADVMILNTCGFINDAKKESIDRIFELAEYREAGKKLVVSGCLSERYSKDLVDEMPEVDAFIGVNEYQNLPAILKEIDSLSKEINEIIEATEIRIYSSDIVSLEESIESTIDKIHELNDTQKINEYMKKIDEYMDTKTEKTGTESNNSYIKTLADQKSTLESKLIETSEIMNSPAAGLISYRIDGQEEILTVNDSKDFSYVTKDVLDSVQIKSGSLIPINTEQGKIVDNFEAYVAVYMETERATFAEIGEKVKLRIASTTVVDAEIIAVNPGMNENERILVFKITDDIEKYLEYRKVQIDVIWWEYSGLKVSNSAIIEEEGKTYVLRKKLGLIEKIYVKVLRQNESYSIVDNYEDVELLEMGYTEDEIKDMNQIKLYDRIVVNENVKNK